MMRESLSNKKSIALPKDLGKTNVYAKLVPYKRILFEIKIMLITFLVRVLSTKYLWIVLLVPTGMILTGI